MHTSAFLAKCCKNNIYSRARCTAKMLDNNYQLLQAILKDLESPGTKAPAKEGPPQTPTGAAEKKEMQR